MPRSPGTDQSSADENLENVDNQANGEHEAPEDHEGEAEVEIRFGMFGDIGDAFHDAGGVIDKGHYNGDNAADRDLHLKHLKELSIGPENKCQVKYNLRIVRMWKVK